jgi:hypothetical protein
MKKTHAQDGVHNHRHVENHNWYQQLKQPGTRYSCCNGSTEDGWKAIAGRPAPFSKRTARGRRSSTDSGHSSRRASCSSSWRRTATAHLRGQEPHDLLLPRRIAEVVKTIVINGKRIAWKEVLRLRQEQLAKERKKTQPALFELRDDKRPASHKTASGRYESPTLSDT